MQEIRQKTIFLEIIKEPNICKFLTGFTVNTKKTNRVVVFKPQTLPRHSYMAGHHYETFQ